MRQVHKSGKSTNGALSVVILHAPTAAGPNELPKAAHIQQDVKVQVPKPLQESSYSFSLDIRTFGRQTSTLFVYDEFGAAS
jgi:hypothetical protein